MTLVITPDAVFASMFGRDQALRIHPTDALKEV